MLYYSDYKNRVTRLEKKMGKETVFIPDGDYDIVKITFSAGFQE